MAPRVMALHHVALPVSDLERSRRFYREVLGLSETERPAAFDFPGAWFSVGAAGQLHLMQREGGTLRNGKPVDSRDVHFTIRVDDFDEALPRARALVTAFAEEPHVNPSTGTKEFALRDPDGYYVMISALA